MNSWIEALLLLFGSCLILVAGIGLVRLPNTFCRAHALSKAVTLGLSLVLMALFWVTASYTAGVKVCMIICFNFVTVPLAGHVFARYAIE